MPSPVWDHLLTHSNTKIYQAVKENVRCQLSSLSANGWIAEEPERWDQTSACKGALLQPLQSIFDHTSPTQTNDGTSQIDYNIGAYVPHSFQTMSSVILCPLPTGVHGWRRQGQRLNVTAQWHDHLKWERDFTASMISAVFFKTSVDGQPPTQQTGGLATQLTRWRLCIAVVSGMVSPKRLNYKNYKTALLE